MKDEEIKAAERKGTPVHVPTVFGAVTVSYKVDGVDKGLKLDGATIADIFLGKIKNVERPGDRQAQQRREPARHVHHGLPPLRRVRHDEALHEFLTDYCPRGRAAPASTRRSSGRPAPAPRATTASRRCIKQTDGAVGYVEQAYALQNNFTFAS